MMRLDIENITKSYGKKIALKQVSMHLTTGIYALLGPNGAGKSTLMNLITQNLMQDQGEIRYNGEKIDDMGKRFRAVLGFVPQNQGLYENFSAYDFLSYMASLKGMSRIRAEEEIEWALEVVNLKEEAGQKLGTFSGGMKQRILVAQAMINDPKVLIMDEPTAGLDPKERIRIRNIISEIAMDKIVIFATHVVSDVEQIAKEVILLQQGTVISQAAPEALCSKLEGKVFEAEIEQGELEKRAGELQIRNLTKREDRLTVRFLSERIPEGMHAKKVRPDLEDVYLYYFAETEGRP